MRSRHASECDMLDSWAYEKLRPYLGQRRTRLALPTRLAKRGGRRLRIPRALCALRSCRAAVACPHGCQGDTTSRAQTAGTRLPSRPWGGAVGAPAMTRQPAVFLGT